jgi:colicin import membrane protein
MALGRPEAAPLDSAQGIDPKVTILLVMEPGKKGIRRFNKTADPVVCVGPTCSISNGAGAPASELEMRRALGPGNTFGRRAGACRGKLSCIFRGVTLAGQRPAIQPVDLKVLVHDRREAKPASPDASCRVVAGRISCAEMIVAPGYRAWIVPERIAQEAGPQELETAVLRGLAPDPPMREASVSR